jgi:S1-C subfamily serine protease
MGRSIRFTTLVVPLMCAVAGAQSSVSRKSIPAIARDAKGAVVSIVMSDKDGHPIFQGSGFLVSKDGQVVTNYHVINNGASGVIKLPDGAFFKVDGVLVSDKNRDVAIIKAHGNDFRTVPLGDSSRLQIGEEVVAIGNPLSLESTVSSGILSGIRTVQEEGGNLLQITAPISPGSSGGPLFNMAGEVVGITTSQLKGGENLNFAIPVNDIKRLLRPGSSRLQSFPDEPLPQHSASGDNSSPACAFITGRMTSALPQVPTLCEETSQGAVSVFSPTPVLAGPFRRAWSTALFQTLDAAAKDGPCESGCDVSVSDSELASRGMHHQSYISKEEATQTWRSALPGFASDERYLLEWSSLLIGTTDERSTRSKAGMESLANSSCQDYLGLLRRDEALWIFEKGFPTCSVMLATSSSAYILLDFPYGVMANFAALLPKAFHYLDRYEGAVILRSPWHVSSDGTDPEPYRDYDQYSLHWLGFIHDEITSGNDSAESWLLMDRDSHDNGYVHPKTLFSKRTKRGEPIPMEYQHAAVYKISAVGKYNHVQLTNGGEFTISTDSVSRCSLKVGDEISLVAMNDPDGENDNLVKGRCRLDASLVGAW